MFTIFPPAIIQINLATIRVRAFKRRISAKNSVNAAANVRIDFPVVDVKLNVTQNNVRAIWRYENVIQIYVKLVVLINFILRKYRVKMLAFNVDSVSYLSFLCTKNKFSTINGVCTYINGLFFFLYR